MRQKNSDGEAWYPPLIQTFSIPEINATVKDSPTEIFGTVGQKKFDGKSWHPPPLLIQTFSIPEINATVKDSPTDISALWEKKFSTLNLDTSPRLIHKLFPYRKFSETEQRTVHLRNFSTLWDKKFSTENRKSWHNPPKNENFRYPKLVEH